MAFFGTIVHFSLQILKSIHLFFLCFWDISCDPGFEIFILTHKFWVYVYNKQACLIINVWNSFHLLAQFHILKYFFNSYNLFLYFSKLAGLLEKQQRCEKHCYCAWVALSSYCFCLIFIQHQLQITGVMDMSLWLFENRLKQGKIVLLSRLNWLFYLG